jgi:hypothetical protein
MSNLHLILFKKQNKKTRTLQTRKTKEKSIRTGPQK